mgnify:CR=1 FL=1
MKKFSIPFVLFVCFIMFTAALKFVDVQPVGPMDSEVGFATVNVFVHNLFGQNKVYDRISDFLAVLSLFAACSFAIIGAYQLLQKKSILKVDLSIILLGVTYVFVILIYVLFEKLVINFRPVLEKGVLEASYPSSHTMMILIILGTARTTMERIIHNELVLKGLRIVLAVLMVLAVAFRIMSGVHWFTDILGALFISAAVIQLYNSLYKSVVAVENQIK